MILKLLNHSLSIGSKFFLVFILMKFDGISQNTHIDSLNKILKNHKANDTTKVNLWNALATEYIEVDTNQTNEYLSKSEQLATTLAFKKGQAKRLFIKGRKVL